MGYNPAGVMTNTGSLQHLASVWYNRTGLDQLKQTTRFYSLTEPDIMPKRNGLNVQWFRYNLLGANTTPHAEGTVGTSLVPGSATVTATLKEYADFISVSQLLEDTAIDPIVDSMADLLGYRAAISVDAIVRTEFDSNTSVIDSTIGATFTAADIRAAVARLKAINVRPKSDGKFRALIHPYITFDLQADNTAGGFIDLMKYADPKGALAGEVGEVGGAKILETTGVGTSGTAPDVLYNSYVVGMGAVGAVDLGGSGPSKVTDPRQQAFKINTIQGGPNTADPEGMIGAYVSYRFVFAVKTLDSTNIRYRIIRANASLV